MSAHLWTQHVISRDKQMRSSEAVLSIRYRQKVLQTFNISAPSSSHYISFICMLKKSINGENKYPNVKQRRVNVCVDKNKCNK